jgi:hypothetical protein
MKKGQSRGEREGSNVMREMPLRWSLNFVWVVGATNMSVRWTWFGKGYGSDVLQCRSGYRLSNRRPCSSFSEWQERVDNDDGHLQEIHR